MLATTWETTESSITAPSKDLLTPKRSVSAVPQSPPDLSYNLLAGCDVSRAAEHGCRWCSCFTTGVFGVTYDHLPDVWRRFEEAICFRETMAPNRRRSTSTCVLHLQWCPSALADFLCATDEEKNYHWHHLTTQNHLISVNSPRSGHVTVHYNNISKSMLNQKTR